MARFRLKKDGRSMKSQWYHFYVIVLIIPFIITIFSYSFSYRLLAEDTYTRQQEHLNSVRNLGYSHGIRPPSRMTSGHPAA